MRYLAIIFILLASLSYGQTSGYSQTGYVNKIVSTEDTVLNSCWIVLDWNYYSNNKLLSITVQCFEHSTKDYNERLDIKEVPKTIEVYMTTNQAKKLSELDLFVKNTFITKCIELNKNWKQTDIIIEK